MSVLPNVAAGPFAKATASILQQNMRGRGAWSCQSSLRSGAFEFSVLVEKKMPAFDQRRSGSGLAKFYAIKTVAETLEVSTRTIRRWIARGDLIAHRVNGVIRIAETDLRAFLALHRES